MLKILSKHKAQSTLEFAVLIAIVVVALLTMQLYMKRGIQGKIREGADEMGSQFSPGQMTSVRTSSTAQYATEDITNTDGTSNSTYLDDRVVTREANTALNYEQLEDYQADADNSAFPLAH
jgi:uncharacterized protein (UPF0333 family)